MDLFEYYDYREFLKDFYQENKKKHLYFSYRYFAGKVGLDSSFLIRVLQGKSHISAETSPKVAKFCKLDKVQTAYFENLVLFCKAKNEKIAKGYYEKLNRLKGVASTQLETYQSEYFSKWYYAAIRAMISQNEIPQDSVALANSLSPAITRKQAEEALDLLVKLNLIHLTENNTYALLEDVVTSGSAVNTAMIHSYQTETMNLAINSLKLHSKEKRDISTVTIPLSPSGLEKIREIMSEARNAAFQVAEDDEGAKEIYQMNIQIFPLSDRQDS